MPATPLRPTPFPGLHMTPRTPLALALISLAVLSACSTTPAPNTQLNQARADFRTAESDPRANRMAAAEMKQAQEALNAANAAWEREDKADDINHLAYLTRQRVAIARETMGLRTAEQAVGNAGATRSAIQLEARTKEANTAQRQTELAKRETQVAQQGANIARANNIEAQRQTELAQAQNRALEERLRELDARPSPRGLVLTLGDVLFDTDKAQLKEGGLHRVRQLAAVLNEYPQRTVLVEGFTHSTGSEAHNMDLSGQRAKAVRDALLNEGINPDRVTTWRHGEANPVASNDSAEGRATNRRVEIILSNGQGLVIAR